MAHDAALRVLRSIEDRTLPEAVIVDCLHRSRVGQPDHRAPGNGLSAGALQRPYHLLADVAERDRLSAVRSGERLRVALV